MTFDAKRYAHLSTSLEISEVRFSALENWMTIGSEYYAPVYSEPVDQMRSSGLVLETLGELCREITDGDHGSADYADDGVRFVLSEAISEGWIDAIKCRYITEAHARTLPRSTFQRGDVLVTKTGVYFGKSAVVEQTFVGANTIAHVGVLRLKKGATIQPYTLSTFLNSRFGQVQLRRRGIKATRPEIKLLEMAGILVPRFSTKLQERLGDVVQKAVEARLSCEAGLLKAEEHLLGAIGLKGWESPEPLCYSRSSTHVFAAKRLDSQFFAPRVRGLIQKLGADGLVLADVANVRKENFRPAHAGTFQYIEIGSLRGDGTTDSQETLYAEAPSRASRLVRSGDVITSTVRPLRRLSAVVERAQDGFVCSSGFTVLKPKQFASEVLLTYLRLPVICELMDLHTSASLYPAISEADLLALPVPVVSDDAQKAIRSLVRNAWESKRKGLAIMDKARRSVEIAVEDSESAALAHLIKL